MWSYITHFHATNQNVTIFSGAQRCDYNKWYKAPKKGRNWNHITVNLLMPNQLQIVSSLFSLLNYLILHIIILTFDRVWSVKSCALVIHYMTVAHLHIVLHSAGVKQNLHTSPASCKWITLCDSYAWEEEPIFVLCPVSILKNATLGGLWNKKGDVCPLHWRILSSQQQYTQ